MRTDYFIAKRRASLLLLISNVIEILALTVVVTGIFSERAYFFREVIAIVANIGFLIIPIEFIIWVVMIVRCKKEKTSPKSISTTMISLVTAISCILTIFSVFVFSQGHSSSAYYPNGFTKLSENGTYYIIVMDRKMKLTKDQYEHIADGEGYAIDYLWNDFLQCSKVLSIEDENGNRF